MTALRKVDGKGRRKSDRVWGHVEAKANHPQIAIRFDHYTFNNIEKLAASARVSFAEEVRRLVAFALARQGATP